MLKRRIRELNCKGSIKDLAAMSGISDVTLYAINLNPRSKKATLTTMEKIYIASKKLWGTGLLPSDYLIGTVFNFEHKRITNK